MAVEVLRPTSTVSNSWPSLAGATAHAALSDDSDTTYIRNNTSTTGVAVFELTNTALTTETIDSIDLRVKARSESSAAGRVRVGVELGGVQVYAAYHNTVPTTATTYDDLAIARPGGGSWTVADLNALRGLAEGDEVTSDGIRCFELSIRVNNSPSGGSSSIKTVNSLAKASVKTVNGLPIASVKSYNGLQ